jgi:hypothetical protein
MIVGGVTAITKAQDFTNVSKTRKREGNKFSQIGSVVVIKRERIISIISFCS